MPGQPPGGRNIIRNSRRVLSVVKDNPDFYAKFPHDVFSKEIFPIARPEPSYPHEIAQPVWEALQEVMFANVSGKDAVANMAKKIDTYLKTR